MSDIQSTDSQSDVTPSKIPLVRTLASDTESLLRTLKESNDPTLLSGVIPSVTDSIPQTTNEETNSVESDIQTPEAFHVPVTLEVTDTPSDLILPTPTLSTEEVLKEVDAIPDEIEASPLPQPPELVEATAENNDEQLAPIPLNFTQFDEELENGSKAEKEPEAEAVNEAQTDIPVDGQALEIVEETQSIESEDSEGVPVPISIGGVVQNRDEVESHDEADDIDSDISQLQEEIRSLEIEISKIAKERMDVEAETAVLTRSKKEFEGKLALVRAREEEVSRMMLRIEEQERSTEDGEARRHLERERWNEAEKRYTVEVEKIALREQFDSILSQLHEREDQYIALSARERSAQERIGSLERKEKQQELRELLSGLSAEKGTIEEKLNELREHASEVKQILVSTETREHEIESDENTMTKQSSAQRSLSEDKEFAEKRFSLEKERHEIEVKRWEIEDQVKQVEKDILLTADTLASVTHKVEVTEKRLESLE